MTIGLLDVARAPRRPDAAPAAADRLDYHARAVPSGEEDPGLLKAHRMGAAGRERHVTLRPEFEAGPGGLKDGFVMVSGLGPAWSASGVATLRWRLAGRAG